MACAAGIANLDIMLNEDLPGKAKATGAYLRNPLVSRLGDHPNGGYIREAGLFLGDEMVMDKATTETFPYDRDILVLRTE